MALPNSIHCHHKLCKTPSQLELHLRFECHVHESCVVMLSAVCAVFCFKMLSYNDMTALLMQVKQPNDPDMDGQQLLVFCGCEYLVCATLIERLYFTCRSSETALQVR